MGMAAILVMWPETFEQTSVPPSRRSSIWNLTLIGPVVSEEKMFKECGRRRRTYLSYKLTKWVFGSAELKMSVRPASVRPAKTQISLGVRPVWSESSLCTHWVAKDQRFLHADNEDSDQTGRMPRLIGVFAGRTLILLVLSCRGSFKTRWMIEISTLVVCHKDILALAMEQSNTTTLIIYLQKKKKKKKKKKWIEQ